MSCMNLRVPFELLDKGLRMQDEVKINVFQKGKVAFKLNRTNYLIKSSNAFNIDYKKCEINLPSLKFDIFEIKLRLIDYDHDVNKARYFIQSTTSYCFKLNGQYVQSAFLSRGDRIEIGNSIFNCCITDSNKAEIGLSEKIIKSSLPILLEGETGTGKTRLARIIHERSGMPGNFIHLNLSSFSPNLIESELFGHKKGAFTGAIQDKIGAIKMANHGTLFLDEVDSLSLDIQTKLLLFVEDLEFRMVGDHQTQKVNLRLIYSSGKKLIDLVDKGTIRKDFYYRLKSGECIELKALRNDKEKIKKICDEFSSNNNIAIDGELINLYQSLSWPGNIRQLKAHLEKKLINSSGTRLLSDELDYKLLKEKFDIIPSENEFITIDELKYKYTLMTFHQLNRNLKKTSDVLGVCQSTLRVILKNDAA